MAGRPLSMRYNMCDCPYTGIFAEGCKSVAAGMNAMDLRWGITMAVDTVVGTISANREREIGELIAKAMEKVGKEGVITISQELEDPLILIHEKKITNMNALVKVLELALKEILKQPDIVPLPPEECEIRRS
ncbi:hypothetical protein QJS04_geneDACA022564 [Acorus gramineus]|uniref:Uncharacterized protein n=1 Tax=Acorus gramineus TaxID=55184 RepID=A0AAV9A0G1_ACOGR|nr:hypothetical protein QJS04_geneDACA022564 [Acorus gramineus]